MLMSLYNSGGMRIHYNRLLWKAWTDTTPCYFSSGIMADLSHDLNQAIHINLIIMFCEISKLDNDN